MATAKGGLNKRKVGYHAADEELRAKRSTEKRLVRRLQALGDKVTLEVA